MNFRDLPRPSSTWWKSPRTCGTCFPSVEGKWDVEVVTNEEIQPFNRRGALCRGGWRVLLGDPDAENSSGWATTGEVGGRRRCRSALASTPDQLSSHEQADDQTGMDAKLHNGRLTQSGRNIVRPCRPWVPINVLDSTWPFVGLGRIAEGLRHRFRPSSPTQPQRSTASKDKLGFTHQQISDGWTRVDT